MDYHRQKEEINDTIGEITTPMMEWMLKNHTCVPHSQRIPYQSLNSSQV